MAATMPLLLLSLLPLSSAKSTIEPCSNSRSCSAVVGYTLYTDLKVSQVASLFSLDPIALLLANAIDISRPDVENHILPSQLFLKVPVFCSCVDGIRKSTGVSYRTRPSDTLPSISSVVYGGLVSADQVREANPRAELSDPSVIPVGTQLDIPLPCTCFNNTDNNLPAVYMSYVVRNVDTLAGIAARYATTVSDLMNANSLGSPEIEDGDILAVPFSACASNFAESAADNGLVVLNGSYAITASHCVQCSCGPGSMELYCTPASLLGGVSCSSMQCGNSNLMLGSITAQQSAAGCNVTSCSYGGYVNGTTIASTLSSSLQPRCPGQQQFPQLIDPPTTLPPESIFSPAAAPSPSLASSSSSGVFQAAAGGPAGSLVSGSSSSAASSLHYNNLPSLFGLVIAAACL